VYDVEAACNAGRLDLLEGTAQAWPSALTTTEAVHMPASTNAFLAWFAEWGQVVYFIVQMLFWVAIAAAALMIALQYKRFVTLKAARHAIEATDAMAQKPAGPRINVEDFVD